ncbi:MAG: hypothetical protein ABEJ65_11105, partial [bacterium]
YRRLANLREEIVLEIKQHDLSFSTTHSEHSEHTRREKLIYATRNQRQVVTRKEDLESGSVSVDRQTHQVNRGGGNRNNVPDPPDNSVHHREGERPDNSIHHIQPDRVEISEEGKEASESEKKKKFELSSMEKMELELIQITMDKLMEGDFEWMDPEEFLEKMNKAMNEELDGEDKSEKKTGEQGESSGESGGADGKENSADFGFSYEYHERHVESERLTFGAEGTIKTEDGQEISFNLNMNISRRFFQKTSMDIQAGNAKLIDPLTVNFDGKAADLSTKSFQFDINADGTKEEIARLKKGSGFLALDKNENGKIDDGSELFGPKTGNGFEELAQYDGDKNRFIDEGDEIFDELAVMTTNSSDGKKLISLDEAGVGAIFLGSANTTFSYKTSDNNKLQGQLERTGIWLQPKKENQLRIPRKVNKKHPISKRNHPNPVRK